MSMLNKDMKDDDCLCFISSEILCLLTIVTLVKIKLNLMNSSIDAENQKKCKVVHFLFLAIV